MIDQKNSQSVRAGSITYFFDVKVTKQGKPYLMITMSRFKGENEDWDRVSIPLFPEHIQNFTKTFLEMSQNIPLSNEYQNTNRPPSHSPSSTTSWYTNTAGCNSCRKAIQQIMLQPPAQEMRNLAGIEMIGGHDGRLLRHKDKTPANAESSDEQRETRPEMKVRSNLDKLGYSYRLNAQDVPGFTGHRLI